MPQLKVILSLPIGSRALCPGEALLHPGVILAPGEPLLLGLDMLRLPHVKPPHPAGGQVLGQGLALGWPGPQAEA